MKQTLLTLVIFVIGSIAVFLCFSCCVAKQSDEYWEKLKDELEKKDDERH